MLKIVKSPYVNEKSSDLDEIWYTTADLESDDNHVTKNDDGGESSFLRISGMGVNRYPHCKEQSRV